MFHRRFVPLIGSVEHGVQLSLIFGDHRFDCRLLIAVVLPSLDRVCAMVKGGGRLGLRQVNVCDQNVGPLGPLTLFFVHVVKF